MFFAAATLFKAKHSQKLVHHATPPPEIFFAMACREQKITISRGCPSLQKFLAMHPFEVILFLDASPAKSILCSSTFMLVYALVCRCERCSCMYCCLINCDM